jgi:hypothetical protein
MSNRRATELAKRYREVSGSLSPSHILPTSRQKRARTPLPPFGEHMTPPASPQSEVPLHLPSTPISSAIDDSTDNHSSPDSPDHGRRSEELAPGWQEVDGAMPLGIGLEADAPLILGAPPMGLFQADDSTLELELAQTLESMRVSVETADLLSRGGISNLNLFLYLSEAELMEEFGCQRAQILHFRLVKDRFKEAKRPVPPAIFQAIPMFRGSSSRSIQDPTLFLERFEGVVSSAGILRTRWATILTVGLTLSEDAGWWAHYLQDHSPFIEWEFHRIQFLNHFDAYDQRLKYQEKVYSLRQGATEGLQSYFDRACSLIRQAHLGMDDALIVGIVRKGIYLHKTRELVTLGERPHKPYTMPQLISAAHMYADRVVQFASTSSPRDSHPDRTDVCTHCHRPGHKRERCRKLQSEQKPSSSTSPPGHRASSFSVPSFKTIPKECLKCPGAGHTYAKCPKNTCSTCGVAGHLNFNCPKATCSSCKAKGHTERSFDCPNKERKKYIDGENLPTFNPALHELTLYLDQRDESTGFATMCDVLQVSQVSESSTRVNTLLYVPVQIEGLNVMAMVDTGSMVSIVSQEFFLKLGAELREESVMLTTVFADHQSVSMQKTTALEIRSGTHTVVHHFLCGPSLTDLLIGMDLFFSLGYGITDLPVSFPGDTPPSLPLKSTEDLSDQEEDGVFTSLKRIPADELDILMKEIEPEFLLNECIGEDEFCTFLGAELPIDTRGAAPSWRPQFRIPERLKPVVDEQIAAWLTNAKIEEASHACRWNSSLLLAPKKDLYGNRTEWRVCFDARPINELILEDTYGIPRIKDLFRRVAGFTHCTALDLIGAFHQLPIQESHRPVTTFSWGSKRYHFKGAPFGLKNVPGHFQRMMTTILAEHLHYVLVYIDDVFIFSDSLENHIVHVKTVIRTITNANLRLRRKKCHPGYAEASLLGHIINGTSIKADPSKVSVFVNLERPRTGKQLQALLGFVGYLRDYIPCYAKISKPLEEIKNLKVLQDVWSEKEQFAFDTLKQILSSAPVLSTPDFTKEFCVATDSSQNGNGAVLYQKIGEEIRYIAFYSKSLNKSQCNYPATKRELLAIIQALKAFRHFIYGQKFELFTDHKALVYMVNAPEPNYMIQNWFEEISEYQFKVTHRPGVEMVLPDALSRLYLSVKENEFFSQEGNGQLQVATVLLDDNQQPPSRTCTKCIHRAQVVSKKCTNGFCKNHCTGCAIHPKLTDLPLVNVDQPVFLDETDPNTVQSDMQEFITNVAMKQDPGNDELRKNEVEKAHTHNHFGGLNLFKFLFRNGYYWKTMKDDCNTVAATCQSCLQHNIVRRGFHPLRTIDAKLPWDHLAIDLGQIKITSAAGSNFFLVVCDLCTRFLIIRSLPDKTAITIARVLYHLFCDFGVAKIIQSDNGGEFVNSIIDELKLNFGFQHRTITSYNPQANGAAEASVKLVKTMLKKHAAGDLSNWCLFLPAIQLALNTRVAKRHHSAPFSLMFTRPCNTFIDYAQTKVAPMTEQEIMDRNDLLNKLLYPALSLATSAHNSSMAYDFQISHKILEDGFPPGAMVMKLVDVKNSGMDPSYEGPFKILSKTRNNAYVLLDRTGSLYPKNVTFSKLKLISYPDFYSDDDHHYEVEEILDHKGPTTNRSYLVKWKGYSPSDNSWVLAKDFDSPLVVKNYWAGKGKKKQRLR